MRRLGLLAIVTAVLAALVVPSAAPVVAAQKTAQKTAHRALRIPSLHVTNQVTGLSIPWDVRVLPGRRLLIDERSKKRLLVWHAGKTTALTGFSSGSVWAAGETGVMGLAVDPSFASNHRVYTCQGGFRPGGGHEIKVVAWVMNDAFTAVKYKRTLVRGFPTTSGRHGGCRLLIAKNGAMLVGTGDAATTANPQSLRSFGGKTLRLNRFGGAPWPANPWPHAKSWVRRYIQTYGHRNVQGLAQRSDGSLWSIEQGTFRDDEVNKLIDGGNYGWQPGPGYDESPPMTNYALPGRQIGAKWSSGNPTLATSGGTFVYGSQWGDLNGTLAVAALKTSQVIFMKFDKAGKLLWTRMPAALKSYGRLRSITQDTNGDLLITTSNATDTTQTNDVVLRVHPQ